MIQILPDFHKLSSQFRVEDFLWKNVSEYDTELQNSCWILRISTFSNISSGIEWNSANVVLLQNLSSFYFLVLDQNLSNSLYNLDFVLSPAVTNIQAEMNVFKASKSLQDDPMEILKKLDNSKIGNESRTRLSPRAKQIVETFEDLSFMHSSVLMFPLHKDN